MNIFTQQSVSPLLEANLILDELFKKHDAGSVAATLTVEKER